MRLEYRPPPLVPNNCQICEKSNWILISGVSNPPNLNCLHRRNVFARKTVCCVWYQHTSFSDRSITNYNAFNRPARRHLKENLFQLKIKNRKAVSLSFQSSLPILYFVYGIVFVGVDLQLHTFGNYKNKPTDRSLNNMCVRYSTNKFVSMGFNDTQSTV